LFVIYNISTFPSKGIILIRYDKQSLAYTIRLLPSIKVSSNIQQLSTSSIAKITFKTRSKPNIGKSLTWINKNTKELTKNRIYNLLTKLDFQIFFFGTQGGWLPSITYFWTLELKKKVIGSNLVECR
jgi:hypothetical protein